MKSIEVDIDLLLVKGEVHYMVNPWSDSTEHAPLSEYMKPFNLEYVPHMQSMTFQSSMTVKGDEDELIEFLAMYFGGDAAEAREYFDLYHEDE